ncbi:MAG: DNA-directed RNA polymerase subunit omega [Myxococcales bacterium]|nr:MAG: DNA-directed RNA polymerase subunit omega [Myxococcales bacterium]
MARVTIEDCLEKVENRFALVHMASKRTRQLLDGDHAMVNDKNKEATLALREIAAGSVVPSEQSAPRARAARSLSRRRRRTA